MSAVYFSKSADYKKKNRQLAKAARSTNQKKIDYIVNA